MPNQRLYANLPAFDLAFFDHMGPLTGFDDQGILSNV